MDVECAICFEINVRPQTLHPCQHTFCLRCIETWALYRRDLTCPQCRSPIERHELNSELDARLLLEHTVAYNRRLHSIQTTPLTTPRQGEIEQRHLLLWQTLNNLVPELQLQVQDTPPHPLFHSILIPVCVGCSLALLATVTSINECVLPLLVLPILPFMTTNLENRLRYCRWFQTRIDRLFFRVFHIRPNAVEIATFYVSTLCFCLMFLTWR